MGELRLGTSGWSYDEWVGPFYPDTETPKLTYYSKVFQTAEIDSTFYAYPSERTVYGWLRRTGSDFIFSAKLPQIITHEKTLSPENDVQADLERFLQVMQPLTLNGKLPAILIQLPPSLRQDLDLLESFLKLLPPTPRFAIEFRHKTWWNQETWRLLRRYRVANTIVDEPLLSPDPVVTTDFAYLRWHGQGRRPWYNYRYKLDELKPWIPKVKKVTEEAKTVVGYFNNHFHGYAVENCVQVLEMLGIATARQADAKRRVQQHIEIASRRTKPEETLTGYIAKEEEPLEDLLLPLTDRGRLRRALEIGDDELNLTRVGSNLVEAELRKYTIAIDRRGKTISHDCADWKKSLDRKSLCKHVIKVLLALPRNEARGILEDISSNKDSWSFQAARE